MNLLSLIVLLLTLSFTLTLGQAKSWEANKLDCPRTRLHWLASAPDSTLSPTSLDSIRKVVAGRWQLVTISGGWSGKSHPPEHPTEIRISQNGKGRTYINGCQVNRFKITLSTRYGYIRCAIPEAGTIVLNLDPRHKGRLYICPQKMVISQDLGDGQAFVFERLTSL